MKKFEFINKVNRSIHRVGLKFKKHSPEILVGAGVAGTVVSAVMACKATTKAGEIIEEKNTQMAQIHEVAKTADPEIYSEEDMKKDTALVYFQTCVKFIKLYGPSVALGALSITAILCGHRILRRRNVAIAAAYTAVDKTFKQYRKRVVENLGEEIDKEFLYGVKSKVVKEKEVDENGKEKTVEKTVSVIDQSTDNPNKWSPFAVIWDCGNQGWCKDPESNKFFLIQQQNHANDLLETRGHLFLNEVYEMLGFPKAQMGQLFGWIYDEKNPLGDNYVDFGIFDAYSENSQNFVNGYERSIILDFNVDGNILEYI